MASAAGNRDGVDLAAVVGQMAKKSGENLSLEDLYRRCREGLRRCLLWSADDIAELESILALDLRPGPGAERPENNPMPDIDERRAHWRRWFCEKIAEWDGQTTARIRAANARDRETANGGTITFMSTETDARRNVLRETLARLEAERAARMGVKA